MGEVDAARRGAAFGGILAAFDTGIGTGSILTGLIIDRFGYSRAYVAAAILAALSIPYFVLAEKRLMKAQGPGPRSVSPAETG
jgi:predicted MFS family arabinose efflux permease